MAGAYFLPDYLSEQGPSQGVPHRKTGGTSDVAMIMENRWRVAYRKETGNEVGYDSTGRPRASSR